MRTNGNRAGVYPVLVLLLATCIMGVTGCSSNKTEAKDIIHLRFAVLGAKQESDLAKAFAHEFVKSHPNIKIDIEPVAGMNYDTKLAMQSAAGTLPDVVTIVDSLVPTLIKYKVVKDIRPYIENDPGFNIADIYPQMLSTGKGPNDEIYMLPRELGVVVMFYNRTLFRRAGLPDPKPDWTCDDFLRMARKLTLRDKNGRITQYGFTASYSWPGIYVSWVISNGGKVMSKDGKRTEFSSAESLRALHTLTDLVTSENVAPSPSQSITAPGVDPFVAGFVAMEPQVFPQTPLFRMTMKKFDWDVQVMPAGRFSRLVSVGAAGYGVSVQTKHPKEAYEFVKFMVSPAGQKILGAAGSGIPVLKSMSHDPCWRNPGRPPKNLDAFINSVNFGMEWKGILPLQQPEVADVVDNAFQDVFNGQRTVEKAFSDADKKIAKILREERN